MPLKIYWNRAKYLGIAFFYFGIMGLFQSLFIIFGQYLMLVGSLYILILIPVGVIIATSYSAMLLYESKMQSQTRKSRRFSQKRKESQFIMEKEMLQPILIVIAVFVVVFFIGYTMSSELETFIKFIIADLSGGIGVLITASAMDKQKSIKIK